MIQINDTFPTITATIQDGSTIVIPESGTKYILFFYPKDNTPGCTAEACSIRDSYSELRDLGYQLYGVSVDSTSSHIKFIEKYQLPFPLISDGDKKIVEMLGLWIQKKFMGREYMGTDRKTILIDATGKISHIIDKIDTKDAGHQILHLLNNPT